ncbi:MAG: tetratricopeptide repeat protein, partial [Anaerolineales bacterium]|nr:tetratricopeptide repeat protein [Anaerolineales bacterium]
MIKRAFGNLYSYILWAFHYWIPMGLSWLFKYPLFHWIYGAALLTALPALVPRNSKFAQITNALLADFQEENTFKTLYTLLTSWLVNNSAVWIAAALLLWLGLQLLWAGKRRKFFEALKKAGLKVVRGRGDHLELFRRIRQEGGVAIGVGLTGDLIRYYLSRQEEEPIHQSFRQQKLPFTQRSFLITAPPWAGKTRTALELIAAFRPPMVIVWPAAKVDTTALFELPKLRCKMAVLADDVSIQRESGKSALPHGLSQMIRDCPGARLFATRRRVDLPQELPDINRVVLETIPEDELTGLAREVSKAEGVSETEVLSRYNGHPGGLIAAVEAMRDRFGKLDRLAQMILWAEKTLYGLGVRGMKIDRLRCVIEGVWDEKSSDGEYASSLKMITRQGFATYQEGNLQVYPGYRDYAVVLPDLPADLPGKTREGLKKCEDGMAFIEIGSSLADEYSAAFYQNPRGSLTAAIQAYEQALRFYTPEAARLNYAMTQNNLGNAYSDLAGHKDPEENLARAVAAYEQALRFYTP